jgi:hypothetical protein
MVVVVPSGHLLSPRSVRLKIPMILNVFGVYDNANNQMLTHGYKKHKTSKQFLDFIKLVDRKYDDNGETDISSFI